MTYNPINEEAAAGVIGDGPHSFSTGNRQAPEGRSDGIS
jgi:hypothetical protein